MTDGAYVSVIEWPELMPEPDRIKLVAEAVGLDTYLAGQAVRRGVPNVLRCMEIQDAKRALIHLSRAGATVFGAKQSAFEKRKEFHAAKRLISGSGTGYLAEAWRGDPKVFDAADITVLIRASLRTNESIMTEGGGMRPGPPVLSPLGAGAAVIATAAAEIESGGLSSQKRLSLTEIIDLHLADGSRIRINGDKFGFDVLGRAKSYTDRQNMDQLALLLSEQAPNAAVDLNFRSFRVPFDVLAASAIPSGRGTRERVTEGSAFDFYSVWAALMYRHLSVP